MNQEFKLAYDIARCLGNGKSECMTCLRKLAPGRSESQVYMGAWQGHGECPDKYPLPLVTPRGSLGEEV